MDGTFQIAVSLSMDTNSPRLKFTVFFSTLHRSEVSRVLQVVFIVALTIAANLYVKLQWGNK